jgi:hypothetical protein
VAALPGRWHLQDARQVRGLLIANAFHLAPGGVGLGVERELLAEVDAGTTSSPFDEREPEVQGGPVERPDATHGARRDGMEGLGRMFVTDGFRHQL